MKSLFFFFQIAVSDGDSVDIKDIVTLVKGGILHASSGLLAIRNPETYRKWGASLKYNPTLIDYEVTPCSQMQTNASSKYSELAHGKGNVFRAVTFTCFNKQKY